MTSEEYKQLKGLLYLLLQFNPEVANMVDIILKQAMKHVK